jgi:mono/diheme cytochrome c family protein
MDTWTRNGFLAAAIALVPLQAAWAQKVDSLPAEVTTAVVTEGKKLFSGAGLCLACHGPDAKGGIGPDLTDDQWLHGGGNYLDILARVRKGVDAGESKSGQIMPPMGGASLSESQIKAVAAFVWTLSHKRAKS